MIPSQTFHLRTQFATNHYFSSNETQTDTIRVYNVCNRSSQPYRYSPISIYCRANEANTGLSRCMFAPSDTDNLRFTLTSRRAALRQGPGSAHFSSFKQLCHFSRELVSATLWMRSSTGRLCVVIPAFKQYHPPLYDGRRLFHPPACRSQRFQRRSNDKSYELVLFEFILIRFRLFLRYQRDPWVCLYIANRKQDDVSWCRFAAGLKHDDVVLHSLFHDPILKAATLVTWQQM